MEAHVTVHLAGRQLPAILSTDHPSGSYGQPLLLMGGGPSYPEGELVAHGPGDITPYGVAGSLLVTEVEAEAPDVGARSLLDAWEALSEPLRTWGRAPSMAETFMAPLRDGAIEDLEPAGHLDRLPLLRGPARHVATSGRVSEGQAWTFPDGSGVVVVLGLWSTFGPDRRTHVGFLERVGRLEWEEAPCH